jgi:hypothetical protein
MAETQDRFLVSRVRIKNLEFIQGQNGLYSLPLKARDDYPEAQEAGAADNISDTLPASKILYSKMFLKKNFTSDGKFDKIKARLVEGGNIQDEEYYDETASPTVD